MKDELKKELEKKIPDFILGAKWMHTKISAYPKYMMVKDNSGTDWLKRFVIAEYEGKYVTLSGRKKGVPVIDTRMNIHIWDEAKALPELKTYTHSELEGFFGYEFEYEDDRQ